MRLLHDLWQHRSGRFGLVIICLLLAILLIGPSFVTDPNQTNYKAQLKPPNAIHLLGTDQAGRDMLSRTLAGGITSLQAAFLVFIITALLGMLLGVSAGMFGGIYDILVSRIIDITLGLPAQIMSLAIVGLLGPNFTNLILALSLTGWATLARLARSCTLGSNNEPYVEAARMAGISNWRILLTHILPNVWNEVLILATLRLGGIILSISGLSFLGLGAQPPTAEWGNMLATARETAAYAPWQLLGPGLGLFASISAAVLISDAIRDISGMDHAIA